MARNTNSKKTPSLAKASAILGKALIPAASKGRKAKAPAKAAKLVGPETITAAVNARTGNGLVVTTNRERSIVISRVDVTVNKLAKLGAPVQPLEAYLANQPKPAGRLANGVDAQNSPHSAKAVRDNKAAAAGSKAAKARGDAAAIAGKGKNGKAAPKAGSMRGLAKTAQKMTTTVKPKDSGLAVGSGRMAKLELAAKCKTTADFLGKVVTDSAGKEHKCDAGALSGMVKRGHVRLG